jgi:hypothetical protein
MCIVSWYCRIGTLKELIDYNYQINKRFRFRRDALANGSWILLDMIGGEFYVIHGFAASLFSLLVSNRRPREVLEIFETRKSQNIAAAELQKLLRKLLKIGIMIRSKSSPRR